jgi:hypothetical protein
MRIKMVKVAVFLFITVVFLGLATCVFPANAINVNVNQDSFVLSNEAPGYAISTLVNAGYGDYNLYDVLVAIQADSNPSVAGVITPQFLATLQNCPTGAEIFTIHLKDVNTQGYAVAISTDGSAQTVTFYGSTYIGTQGSSNLNTVISGAGSFRIVCQSNQTVYNPQFGMNVTTPLTSLTVNGPLAGMTTTYNVFGILYMPSATVNPTDNQQVPNTANYTYLIATIVAAIAVIIVVSVVLKKRKPKKQ